MKKVWALIRMFRPLNLTLGAIAVLISAAVLNEFHQVETIIIAIIVVVFLNSAANAFNDYMDLEADRINRIDRPLVQGLIPQNWALWSSIVLFATGIFISSTINKEAFIIATLIAIPIMVAYSLWLEGWPLVGNIAVSFILGLTFIFAGAALGHLWGLLVPALLAFGFTLIRELIKDMADIEGDLKAHLNTFPVRFGFEKSLYLAIAFIVLLSIGALIPYWLGIYGKFYLIVLLLGIEIPLLFVIFLLMKFPTIRTCNRISQILKACIFAGLLAVYLG